MATEINMSSQGNAVGKDIDNLKSEVYSQIEKLKGINSTITMYSDYSSSFLADATDLTYDNVEKAVDIISDVTFDTVPTRDLLGSSEEPNYGHTFNSSEIAISLFSKAPTAVSISSSSVSTSSNTFIFEITC